MHQRLRASSELRGTSEGGAPHLTVVADGNGLMEVESEWRAAESTI
jgi:hypothetical protein